MKVKRKIFNLITGKNFMTGNLRKLTKSELKKYIKHHNLMRIDKSTSKIKMLRKIEKHLSSLLEEDMKNENPVNTENLLNEANCGEVVTLKMSMLTLKMKIKSRRFS